MGKTVLIVDDHSGFRATARELLECEGYEVVGEAADAATAIAEARRLQPDIVLLDVQLPDFDGVRASHRDPRSERQSSARGPGLEPGRIGHGGRARDVPGLRLHLQVEAER